MASEEGPVTTVSEAAEKDAPATTFVCFVESFPANNVAGVEVVPSTGGPPPLLRANTLLVLLLLESMWRWRELLEDTGTLWLDFEAKVEQEGFLVSLVWVATRRDSVSLLLSEVHGLVVASQMRGSEPAAALTAAGDEWRSLTAATEGKADLTLLQVVEEFMLAGIP